MFQQAVSSLLFGGSRLPLVEEHCFPDAVFLPGQRQLRDQEAEFSHPDELVEKAALDGHLVVGASLARCSHGSHLHIAGNVAFLYRSKIIVTAAAAGKTAVLESKSYGGLFRSRCLKIPRSQNPFRAPYRLEAQSLRLGRYDKWL